MANNNLSRRKFLHMSAMASSAALLAACGGTPAATPTTVPVAPAPDAAPTAVPAAEPAATGSAVSLNVLNENWGDIYNNLMVVIGDDYTKTNPSTKIDWNFDPDWQTKLTTLLAANTPPDATIMRPAPLATLAAKGALLDLTALVQETGLKREDFVTPLYDSSLHNGKLYAIPGGADYWCLFYSKDVYREVGLDPEKPPLTFDELIAHSKQVLKKDSSGDIQRIGFNPSAGWFVNWAYIFGGELYDANTQKITANHPANIEALTQLQAYIKLLDINKLAAFNQRPGTFEAGNPFATKQAAFVFDGFWTYEAFDQHAPDLDYGVAFWPTLKGTPEERKNYVTGGWQYAIPTGSKQADAAWKFIRYAFIDQSAKMGYLTLNGTTIKSQFGAWEDGVKQKMGAKNRMAAGLKYFTDTAGAASKLFPVLPVMAFYQDELNRVYDLVMRDQKTPKEGLDEVTKNVQSELDKAMKG